MPDWTKIRGGFRCAAGALVRGSLIFWFSLGLAAGAFWMLNWLMPLSEGLAQGMQVLFCCGLAVALSPVHSKDRHVYMLATREQTSRRWRDDGLSAAKTPSLLAETAVVALWTLIFPQFSASVVTALAPSAVMGSTWFGLLQLLLFVLPFWLFTILGGAIARRRWFRRRRSYAYDAPPREMAVGRTVREIVLWMVDALLLILLLVILYEVAAGSAQIVRVVWKPVGVPLLTVLGLYVMAMWLRAVSKRARFVRRLRVLCRQNGAVFTLCHAPLPTLFFPRRTADFTVEHEGCRYAGKWIACRNPRVPVMLQPGSYEFYHRLGLAAVFLPVRHRFSFADEPQGTVTMLAFSPPTQRIFLGTPEERTAADNGDTVDGTLVFSDVACGNYLERQFYTGI